MLAIDDADLATECIVYRVPIGSWTLRISIRSTGLSIASREGDNLTYAESRVTIGRFAIFGLFDEAAFPTHWCDFERLFKAHPAPGAYPCWCMYNHHQGPATKDKQQSRVIRTERNRREKKELVERGCAHGILVYKQAEPVGWCQYGRPDELPRIDNNPKYRQLSSKRGMAPWRITCFVVRRDIAATVSHALLSRQHWPLLKRKVVVWSKLIQSRVGALTPDIEERYPCSKRKDFGSSLLSVKVMS